MAIDDPVTGGTGVPPGKTRTGRPCRASPPSGRPTRGPNLAAPGEEANAQTRWLDPAEVTLSEDRFGRLVLALDGHRFDGVQAGKAFALSDPDRYICFREEAGGGEIGILKDPAALAPDSLAVLRRHLEQHYFIPVVRKVLRIKEFWIDQTWTVVTDRGPREFTIQGRDSIRFLSDRSFLLMDVDDNRYLMFDRTTLDRASRKWVDRFVW